ncbi:MAG: lactate utilization protein, partial [Bacilli bacterium]|nr:lactate utilization protein [Bacilli bacterium]
MDKRIEKTIKNLEKNNIKCFFVEKKEDVIPLLS